MSGPRLVGCVLAGGRSSRFGSDKALARRHGEVGIVWLARRLREVGCDEVFAVADVAGRYDVHGVPTVADPVPHLGPVSGLRTALRYAAPDVGDALLIVPCDLATWPDGFVEAALGVSDGLYVSPRTETFRPLPAILRTGVAETIERLTAGGTESISLRRLLDELGDRARTVDVGDASTDSFNTPAEYRELVGEGGA